MSIQSTRMSESADNENRLPYANMPGLDSRDTNKGFTVWLTGLSGAGKSTISRLLEQRLIRAGRRVEVLDGDVLRRSLSNGLGFSKKDRDENIQRIGFVCELLSRNGIVAIAAAISPYRAARDEVRSHIRSFVEVYVECPIATLVKRDVKGLYKRALAGEILHFTGITDPYEPPHAPEVVIHSDTDSPEQSVDKIIARLQSLELIRMEDCAFVGEHI